jgi:general secretion pathway protein L
MHVLAIDVGSYSVKYISSFVDKRKVSHVEMSEIIVRDYLADHEGLSFRDAQLAIVEEILGSVARPDTKVIYQADNEMMTTRFLILPVKSKKKAELMLPFQLEEDIPYALSEIHYAYRMEAQKTQHVAMVELAKEASFEEYFHLVREKNILPNILTTEASVTENFFNQTPMAGPFCVLDIGHKTTKAYFFYNSRLLVTHVSYMGGQHVNEMIAQTYRIEPDEAIFYKHQNAFMLTESQYEGVEPAQKEFASSMDKVFNTLIADFARWKVGFKVNFGLSVNQIYLCGGSSNIKNLANYLTEKWDTKVSLLESFDKVETEKIDLNPKSKSKFALVNMMAQGFKKKNRFINLLSGQFAQASTSEIPLHSLAFLGVRVAALTALLAISLLVERIFIEKDIQYVNSRITAALKNPELQITGRLRRSIATDPRPVLNRLVKRQRSIKQEISTLQSAIEIQALSPLVTLSQIAAGSQATLTEFSSSDAGNINAIFTANSVEPLVQLKGALERSSLSSPVIDLDQKRRQLKVSAGI